MSSYQPLDGEKETSPIKTEGENGPLDGDLLLANGDRKTKIDGW
jgi:hypothetical protein